MPGTVQGDVLRGDCNTGGQGSCARGAHILERELNKLIDKEIGNHQCCVGYKRMVGWSRKHSLSGVTRPLRSIRKGPAR